MVGLIHVVNVMVKLREKNMKERKMIDNFGITLALAKYQLLNLPLKTRWDIVKILKNLNKYKEEKKNVETIGRNKCSRNTELKEEVEIFDKIYQNITLE